VEVFPCDSRAQRIVLGRLSRPLEPLIVINELRDDDPSVALRNRKSSRRWFQQSDAGGNAQVERGPFAGVLHGSSLFVTIAVADAIRQSSVYV